MLEDNQCDSGAIERLALNVHLIVFLALHQKEVNMAKKAPWHSTKQSVHHNNTDCNTGNNIETENLRQGTGGKPLCKECDRLS